MLWVVVVDHLALGRFGPERLEGSLLLVQGGLQLVEASDVSYLGVAQRLLAVTLFLQQLLQPFGFLIALAFYLVEDTFPLCVEVGLGFLGVFPDPGHDLRVGAYPLQKGADVAGLAGLELLVCLLLPAA